MVQRIIEDRRKQLKQLSQEEQPLEVKKTTFMPTALDEFAQVGSSFYSPYTDTLSVLRTQNPLLRPTSLTL